MSQERGGFGGELYKRLEKRGLSRTQIYKTLALQRLAEDVLQAGREHNLPEGILVEISKVRNPAAQKQLIEVVIEHQLSGTWAKELSRLIRLSEGLKADEERSRVWDFFFRVRDELAERGPGKVLLKKIKEFRATIERGDDPRLEGLQDEEDKRVVDFRTLDLEVGKGLDVGTANIISAARHAGEEKIVHNIQRNAFLDLKDNKFTKKVLAKLGIEYTAHENRLYVVGDPAFELANVFEREARRPMKDGMISPYEPEALLIVDQLIHQLLGPPQTEGEICAFSVPAPPIDMERDNIYHQGVLESLLSRNGYTAKPILEGMAVIFSELEDTSFTGIGISCGGGMFNVAVAYRSIPAAAFSTSRGGDWVDYSVGKAVGLAGSQVAAIKESGVCLLRPKDRVEEAIAIYYHNLIRYTLDHIRRKIEDSDTMPEFSEPVPVVFAGGTSLVGDFAEVARREFEKVPWPFEIAEIRLAKDPLYTVSRGCLIAAQQETAAVRQRGETASRGSPFRVRELPGRTKVDRNTLRLLGAVRSGKEAPEKAPRGKEAATERVPVPSVKGDVPEEPTSDVTAGPVPGEEPFAAASEPPGKPAERSPASGAVADSGPEPEGPTARGSTEPTVEPVRRSEEPSERGFCGEKVRPQPVEAGTPAAQPGPLTEGAEDEDPEIRSLAGEIPDPEMESESAEGDRKVVDRDLPEAEPVSGVDLLDLGELEEAELVEEEGDACDGSAEATEVENQKDAGRRHPD